MKKRLSVILLAIVMCFAAAGCNNDPVGEYKLTVISSNIECELGQTPDWSKAVRLMLGDQEIPFSADAVAAQLRSGHEDEVGRCTYNVRYEYGGVMYGPVIVYVSRTKPKEPPVVDPDDDLHKSNMTAAQREVLQNAFARRYKHYAFNMGMTYGSVEIRKQEEFALNSVKSDDENVSKLVRDEKHLLERVLTPPDGKEIVSSDEWYLKRTQETEGDNVIDDIIAVYIPLNEGTEEKPVQKWVTRTIEYSEFASNDTVYSDYYPVSFAMSDLDVELDWFDAVENEDRKYDVHDDYLLKVAGAIFGVSSNEFPRKIELTVSPNGDVTNVTYEYDIRSTTVQRVTINVTWEGHVALDDAAAPNVSLPSAVEYTMPAPEDYKDDMKPVSGASVAGEELEKLNKAFALEYDNVTYSSEQNLQSMITKAEGSTAGKRRYNSEDTYVDYLGQQTLAQSAALYAEISSDGNSSVVYQIESELGDYIKFDSAAGESSFNFFLQPKDMEFSGDWFAQKEGASNEYVITKDALPDLKAKVLTLFEGISSFASLDAETLTVKLDNSGNLVKWYMLFKYQETRNTVPSYWKLTYSYENIGSTKIVLPAGNNTVAVATETQKQALTNAVNTNHFSNVTVTETAADTVATFDGNSSILSYYENFMGYPFPATDEYEYDKESGKYLRWDWAYGDADDEKGSYVDTQFDHADSTANGEVKRGYDYYMPHFHFDEVDNTVINNMLYDSDANTYILRSGRNGATDENIKAFVKEFIYYMYVDSYVYKGVDITLGEVEINANGDKATRVVGIKLLMEVDMAVDDYTTVKTIRTFSAAFSDYGTTKVVFAFVQDALDVEAQIADLAKEYATITAENYEAAKKAIKDARASYSALAQKSLEYINDDSVSALKAAEQKLADYETTLQQPAE